MRDHGRRLRQSRRRSALPGGAALRQAQLGVGRGADAFALNVELVTFFTVNDASQKCTFSRAYVQSAPLGLSGSACVFAMVAAAARLGPGLVGSQRRPLFGLLCK